MLVQQPLQTSNHTQPQDMTAQATGDMCQDSWTRYWENSHLITATVGWIVYSATTVAGAAPGQPTHTVLKLLTPIRALTSPPALTYKCATHMSATSLCITCASLKLSPLGVL